MTLLPFVEGKADSNTGFDEPLCYKVDQLSGHQRHVSLEEDCADGIAWECFNGSVNRGSPPGTPPVILEDSELGIFSLTLQSF